MDLLEQESNHQLHSIITHKIHQEGPITFKEFMALALYHPEHGYYTSLGQKIGRDGDYYTSVHVSNLFGQTLTRQLVEMGSFLQWDGLVLVEYGAGEGYLAKDILESLEEQFPQLARNITYYICERSGYHRQQQRQRLHSYLTRVKWVDEALEINSGKPFKGIIFSNELVDAFPVHRVIQKDGKLKEIYIGFEGGSFVEVIGDLSEPSLAGYFPFLNFSPQEGQEAEINLDALEWLRTTSRYLTAGFLLTIDYGYEMRELASPRFFDGTIMCYRKHQADGKPLKDVGLKDITSHVNFTALMEYGKEFGFKVTGFTNQMKFLAGLQIGKRLEDPQLSEPERRRMAFALRELLMPERMGERFRVLIQHKGLDSDPPLSGLKGFA